MATKAELARNKIAKAIVYSRRQFLLQLLQWGRMNVDGTFTIRRPIVDRLRKYIQSSDSDLEERETTEALTIADRVIEAIDK